MPAVDQAPPPPCPICDPCGGGCDHEGAPGHRARTLPVAPAERFLATVLRAWLEWCNDGAQMKGTEDATMMDMWPVLQERGFVTEHHGQPTPTGAALLARVEAAPDRYEQGRSDAVAAAADHLSACHDPAIAPRNAARMIVDHEAGRLAGTTPIDAPANAYKIGPISAGRVVTAVSTPTRIHTAAGSVVELLPGESVEIEPCQPAKEPR